MKHRFRGLLLISILALFVISACSQYQKVEQEKIFTSLSIDDKEKLGCFDTSSDNYKNNSICGVNGLQLTSDQIKELQEKEFTASRERAILNQQRIEKEMDDKEKAGCFDTSSKNYNNSTICG
ncbi:MAG: hypothetical protein WC852_05250 [Candidatus Nanoarchaeia archaeon]|jgi:hypothetical protein